MNPFKKLEDLEKEINFFLGRHKTFLSDQGKRISDYFEMSCYNKLVRYYEKQGFTVSICNLINNKFRYKLSPGGYPENFSFFQIKKAVSISGTTENYCFEIHHNLTVQSGHQEDIYLTPDISVINVGTIISDYDHYLVANSTKKFCYVKNTDLQTFCEVKNFTPFPELLYNFIGLYNELKANSINRDQHDQKPFQIAPGLLISGKGNEHTSKIKRSLESRYSLNILFDLFEKGLLPANISSFDKPKQILSMKVGIKFAMPTISPVIYDISDELPF